jgi:chemotaxis protein CheC
MQFTQYQIDAVTELMNVASGRAASALAGILNQRVHIDLLELKFLSREEMEAFLASEIGLIGSAVEQDFTSDLNGSALLLFKQEHAANMIQALLKENRDLASLTSADVSILGEVGNVLLNACVATLCRQINKRVRFQVPVVSLRQSGEVVASAIVQKWPVALQAIVLKSRMRVGQIETVVYILIVLAIHFNDWKELLESLPAMDE